MPATRDQPGVDDREQVHETPQERAGRGLEHEVRAAHDTPERSQREYAAPDDGCIDERGPGQQQHRERESDARARGPRRETGEQQYFEQQEGGSARQGHHQSLVQCVRAAGARRSSAAARLRAPASATWRTPRPLAGCRAKPNQHADPILVPRGTAPGHGVPRQAWFRDSRRRAGPLVRPRWVCSLQLERHQSRQS